jgi:hypothetical protein
LHRNSTVESWTFEVKRVQPCKYRPSFISPFKWNVGLSIISLGRGEKCFFFLSLVRVTGIWKTLSYTTGDWERSLSRIAETVATTCGWRDLNRSIFCAILVSRVAQAHYKLLEYLIVSLYYWMDASKFCNFSCYALF